MKQRLHLLVLGVLLGACVERTIDPPFDPEPICSAWCEGEVACGFRDESVQTCADGCATAPVWTRDCALEFEAWMLCITELSCEDQALREDFPSDRPHSDKPCFDEELAWQAACRS